MFRKLLIANRGEIAVRINRAAHALGVRTVAVYSEADRLSPHVEAADEKVCIGGPRSDQSYLRADALLQAAEMTDCQAIHPGYGFLAENALFAARCQQHRLAFVGPSGRMIQVMGDKAVAKRTMKEAGLPTIPGSDGILASLEEARGLAGRIGYPVLLKATAGGGGKGMRVVLDQSELEEKYQEARLEADKAFGNPALYLEKFINNGRHIEFQILADNFGNVIHLGERECSIQRKNQKLVEESPSPAISASIRKKMGDRIVKAIRQIGYVNAGTVEFFMDPEGQLYFMEMNTRLQVEHPVTEMITGLDIVQEQLKIAAQYQLGLSQKDVQFEGHSLECRINAEDPDNNFQPNPGKITRFEVPGLERDGAVRLDSHVREGYTIPPYYDSLIGKLIVHGQDRAGAIELMRSTLEQTRIEGVTTTIGLHRTIMKQSEFIEGKYSTRFIPDILKL
ncbi:acetyl-CoA carboxylase biotin carboxylase subunit [bacterium]|nr:acetyl-CoA carboxylase biotin carboxylase subunit [bacterium]